MVVGKKLWGMGLRFGTSLIVGAAGKGACSLKVKQPVWNIGPGRST